MTGLVCQENVAKVKFTEGKKAIKTNTIRVNITVMWSNTTVLLFVPMIIFFF